MPFGYCALHGLHGPIRRRNRSSGLKRGNGRLESPAEKRIVRQHFYRQNADKIYTAAVGIKVKAGEQWRSEFNRPLAELHVQGIISSAWGVYLGNQVFQAGPVRVLPLQPI